MTPELIGGGIALLAVALVASRMRNQVEAEQGEALPGLSLANAVEELEAVVMAAPVGADANVAAFLWMIRTAEGTAGPEGYRTMFGGDRFERFDDHPRIAHRFTDREGRVLWTTAAGAYQFMAVSPLPTGGTTRVDTWDRIRRKLGLADFTPASQDRAAVELIDEAGALLDVQAGRFADAVVKVRRVWASMPGAGYAQPERKLAELQAAYLNAGGTLA